MALTRSFKERMTARVQADPAFASALLAEAVDAMLSGDLDTGKAVLRDHINAGLGFDRLSALTGTPVKSLMRMFSPSGNPNARNLFRVIGALQAECGISLALRAAA